MTATDATGGAMMVATGAPSVAQDPETGAGVPPSAPVSALSERESFALLQRIMPRIVEDENGCWIWTGEIRSTGYGATYAKSRGWSTHRVSYEAMRAPIPAGLEIDHLCRVRACMNPWHLEPVTHLENMRRAPRWGRDHGGTARKPYCPRGRHAMTPENSRDDGHGSRRCAACKLDQSRRRRAALKAA